MESLQMFYNTVIWFDVLTQFTQFLPSSLWTMFSAVGRNQDHVRKSYRNSSSFFEFNQNRFIDVRCMIITFVWVWMWLSHSEHSHIPHYGQVRNQVIVFLFLFIFFHLKGFYLFFTLKVGKILTWVILITLR